MSAHGNSSQAGKRVSYAIHDAKSHSIRSSLDSNELCIINNHMRLEKAAAVASQHNKYGNSHASYYDNLNQYEHSFNEESTAILNIENETPLKRTSPCGNKLAKSDSLELSQNNERKRKIQERSNLKKEIINKRLLIADWAFFFGTIGFVLMIIENELTMAKVYDKVWFNANILINSCHFGSQLNAK